MRKNLLITTALGLAAALPSLAMAEAAASGAAVGGGCQSGFFFGVEAKGASMRLRIKKDTKADLESAKELAKSAEDLATDEDALAADIAAEKLEAVKALLDKTAVTGLGLDAIGTAAGAALAAGIAAIAPANGNAVLEDFADPEAAALYELLRLRGLYTNAAANGALGAVADTNTILDGLAGATVIAAAGVAAGVGISGEVVSTNAGNGALARLARIANIPVVGSTAGVGTIVAADKLGLAAINALLKDTRTLTAAAGAATGPAGAGALAIAPGNQIVANDSVVAAGVAATPATIGTVAAAGVGLVPAHINGVALTDTVAQATVKVLKNILNTAATPGVSANADQKAVAAKFIADYNTLKDTVVGGKLYDANGKALAYKGQSVLSLIETGGYIIKDKKKYLLAGAKNSAAAGAPPVFARGTAVANTAPTAAALGTLLASGPTVDGAEVLVLASEDAVAKAITTTKDSLKTSTTLVDTLKASDLVKELAAQKAASNKAANEANKATNAKNKDFAAKQVAKLAEGQTEHNSSLMGGVGAVAGYRHVLGQFAVSARVGADYLWGGFRTVETDGSKSDDKIAKLGFGVSPAVGVHFLASPSAELGLVGGVRFGQLQARKTDAKKDDKKGDYTSKWIWMPFLQGEATVWFAQNISGSVFAGYNFAVAQKFDKDNTEIKKDVDVKVDGIFGGFRVAYHF